MKIPTLVETHKKYYSAYSVMALLNAQNVLDHIGKLAGVMPAVEAKRPSENLWEHPVMSYLYDNFKSNSGVPEITVLIMERLQHYFPFLKIMAQQQREYSNKTLNTKRLEVNTEDQFKVLNNILRVLKMYRDYTAHYELHDPKWQDGSEVLRYNEQPLAQMLDRYYEVALRNTKEKYSYTTEELAFIQNFRKKIIRTPDGRKQTRDNLDFFLAMKVCNGDTEATKALHISSVGVAQLLCLFLDKQYVNIFLRKLPIYSKFGPNSKEAQLIIRSMGVNSIRLPKDRIHSEKDALSVALDMLNELKRCPAELFDALSADKQARFRIPTTDRNEVLMMRHSDRFPQLLLQAIDQGYYFSHLRIHVNMGKLRYLFNAEKHCVDGQTRVRVLEHPLNAFGRLQEMEAMRKHENLTFAETGIPIRDFEHVQRDDANTAHYPYIVDTYTHYMLENNKVEMAFCDDSGYFMPQVEKYAGKWYVSKPVAACRMSVFELPAMAFHLYLCGAERTEARIREVYDQYKRLFSDMSRGRVTRVNLPSYGIAEADLPQKVIRCLDHTATGKDMHVYIRKTLDALLDDTTRRLERLREDKKAVFSRDNKMGKRGFCQIRPGVLADFLARDIVRFQPSAFEETHGYYGSDKLTGMNFRVIQSTIATYNSHGDQSEKEAFRKIFERAKLIGADTAVKHPFLDGVFRFAIPDNAIDFYANYLKQRKAYLAQLQRELKSGRVPKLPFINSSANQWRKPNLQLLGTIYGEDLAIELPRQLFDADIKAKLKTIPAMKGVDFDHANVTYLIGEFLRRELDDDFQPFYGWSRHYRYIDMLSLKLDRRGILQPVYTTVGERETLWTGREKRNQTYTAWAVKASARRRVSRQEAEENAQRQLVRARHDFQRDERAIRRYKVQDALLFLLAKMELTKTADFEGKKFKLRDIVPDADKGILSEVMPMRFSFERNGQRYTITSEGMKLKNFGDFFPLAADKRLPNLLQLVGSGTVDKEKLTEEFNRYNLYRPKIATLVFDLEKFVYDRFPEAVQYVKDTKAWRGVQFGDVLQILASQNELNPQQSEMLRVIRNAFDHNNYPDVAVVEITTLPEVARALKQCFEHYAQLK